MNPEKHPLFLGNLFRIPGSSEQLDLIHEPPKANQPLPLAPWSERRAGTMPTPQKTQTKIIEKSLEKLLT